MLSVLLRCDGPLCAWHRIPNIGFPITRINTFLPVFFLLFISFVYSIATLQTFILKHWKMSASASITFSAWSYQVYNMMEFKIYLTNNEKFYYIMLFVFYVVLILNKSTNQNLLTLNINWWFYFAEVRFDVRIWADIRRHTGSWR